MSDEAIRLIGYMIGDGAMSKMSFTKTSPEVLEDVLRCAESINETGKLYRPAKKAPYIQFSSVGPVSQLMHDAGFTSRTLSGDKSMPLHLGMSDRQLGQLLGALWSTDGCIDTFRGKKLRVIYTSVSRELCIGIQHALQRLGVVANVRTTSVLYKGDRRPVSTVNVVTRQGKRAFLQLAAAGVIPVTRSSVSPLDAFGFITDSQHGADGLRQPRRDDFIWWDRVEAVTREADEMTYDVEVPGLHTFVVDGIITHNTSASDVSVGSSYRRALTTNEQVSFYWVGAMTLGFKPDVVIYDILSKPSEKPLHATPVDKRVYVTDRATKEKRLKAGQRLLDETPEEYLVRMLRGVVKEPDKWITRVELVRLAHERKRFALELIERARFVEVSMDENAWPRKSAACYAYGGSGCQFLPHCSEGVALDDPKLFRRIDPAAPHEELAEPSASP